MPIEAQTVEYVYTGDGVSTVFQFPSRFLSNADITVALAQVEQLGGFTVAGAGAQTGGTVTFSVAPAAGVRVSLVRKPPASQLIDFINGQTILEGTLDNALDKLTMIGQYLLRSNVRTIRLSDFDVTTALTPLPGVVDRANRFLAFNSDGDLALAANIDGVGVAPFASQAEAETPVSTSLVMSPLRTKQQIDARLATQVEAEAGVDNVKLMTPMRVAQAIAKLGGGTGQFYDAVVNAGVDNTGATNVTAALETFFAAAATAKKVAYLPEGVYEIGGGSIDITADSLEVVAHKNAVIRKTLNVTGPAVKVVANGLRWTGGNINYTNASTVVDGAHAGIWIEGTDNHVEKLKVKGRFYVGVYLLNCVDSVVRDCIAKGTLNRAFYCAFSLALGDANIVFDNCYADGAEAEGGATRYTNYGFNTNGFGTGIAYNIRFVNCFTHFITAHGFGMSERITECTLTGCRADDINGPGFLVQEANGFRCSRIIFNGCSATRAQTGFLILNSDYVTLAGCKASVCTGSGFQFTGCSNVALPGALSDNNAGWGFISDAGSSRCGFVGCIATANVTGSYSIAGSGHATIGNL